MKRISLGAFTALAFLAVLSVSVWIHRIHIDQPEKMHLITSDTYRYFYPTATYLHEQLQQGNFPLWNPYQMAGQPFLALQPPGVLYPPNLLLMGLLSPEYALGAHVVLHVFLAGLFTWLLAARMGLGPLARLCAAFVYMISGPLLLGFYMAPFLATPAWFPAILWSLTALLQEGRARWGVSLAIFTSLAFLSGHVQALLYILQASLLYALAGLLFLTPRGLRLRAVGWAVVGAIVSFGLVAPQLFPSVELTQQAVRSFDGVSLHQAQSPHVSALGIETGLVRNLIQGAETIGTKPINALVVFPVVALPLIVFSLFARRQLFYTLTFLGLALLSALFIMGPESSLFRMYYQLPLGNLFRGPSRMSFVYALSIALLMGIGFQSLWSGLSRLSAHRALAWIVSGGLLLFILVDSYSRTVAVASHPALTGPLRGAPERLVEILRTSPGRERTFVQTTGFYSVGLLYKFGMMNEVFAVPDYEPSMPGAYAEYFSMPENPPWHGQLHVLPSRPEAYQAPLRLLDLMSVRYYAMLRSGKPDLTRELSAQLRGRPEIFPEFDLVPRRHSLPRVYAVNQVRFAPDIPSAVEQLQSRNFQTRRQIVVVDPDPEGSDLARMANRPDGKRLRTRTEITRYEGEEVAISARCARDCVLVLTDLFYPGWKAYVDGEERTIHQVNGLFRGVELEAGPHEIVYRYEPASFRLGLACLALTLLGGLAGALYARRGPHPNGQEAKG